MNILPEEYTLNFKFITKQDEQKIVLKISYVADETTIAEHFVDLLWWTGDGEDRLMNYANGIQFTLPPTRTKVKEKILIWLLTLGLFWSIVGHILR